MRTDKWATSKFTQVSMTVYVKLLLLLENALKLNSHCIHEVVTKILIVTITFPSVVHYSVN